MPVEVTKAGEVSTKAGKKETAPDVVNGVNVTDMSQTITAVKADPGLAKFQLRLRNEWIDGAHTRSAINGFHGLKQELEHRHPFKVDSGEPDVLLGNDSGPNAGEILLAALAACVTGAIVYHAAARGIAIEAIESKVEGDIDLRGFLGIDKNVRNGFQDIRMNFSIRANVSDQELAEIAALGPAFSPVFDTLTKGVPVTVDAQRMNGN